MTPQKLVILIDGIRNEFEVETFELSFNKYEGTDIMLIAGTVEGNADAQAGAPVSESPAEPEPGKVAVGVAKPSLTGITEEANRRIPFEGAVILNDARIRLGITFSPPPADGTDVQVHTIKTKYYDYEKPGCMSAATSELTAAEALLLKDKKGFISKPPEVVFNKKDHFRIEEVITIIKEEIQS